MEEYHYNLQGKELPQSTTPADIEENWLWAVVGYMGPLFLLVLSMRRESAFATYHARQGKRLFFFSLVWFLAWILMNQFFALTKQLFILITGFGMAGLLWVLVLLAVGITNVAKKKMEPLPFIGA